MGRRTNFSLSLNTTLDAACALLSEVGLEGVTMRSVAARLGVQAPALYTHVCGKDELLSLMVSRLYWRAREGLDDSTSATHFLRQLGLRLRTVMRESPNSAQLFAVAGLSDELSARQASLAIAPLLRFGLSDSEAFAAHCAVMSLCLGFAQFSRNKHLSSFLRTKFDLDQTYEHSLNLLVDGFFK